jgi:hypothetical protein
VKAIIGPQWQKRSCLLRCSDRFCHDQNINKLQRILANFLPKTRVCGVSFNPNIDGARLLRFKVCPK